ncbi:MAG TPA: carboxypeptidase regulatory-like domain-containing protein [Terriglobales bacterium]|nr:carboxypeptidase regulatory-like domain-containing protein [Terriglobales bacterium]
MGPLRVITLSLLLAFAATALATIFGSVRGIVHDPQHRVIQGAKVTLKAVNSDWTQSQESGDRGQFEFTSVPIGNYTVTVSSSGFQATQQEVIVQSDTSPVLHFKLAIAGVKETVAVSGAPVEATTQIVTPTTMVSREDIQQTPGADRTNGMEMITDYVPAAYMVHDMLHMRGGHQLSWLIDGVPIPNTNIANNLGPQIDPKDIDYLEVQRGSYDADYGDRTYGVFNVVPRTGFERNRECDLVITAGNFYQTDNQISCGSHSERSAYYASLNGNRSQYGLMTPIPEVVNDAANGIGGFASFIFNPDPKNQYRLVGSLRRDYYQIPIDPDLNSTGNQILVASGLVPSSGLHDAEVEPDGYATFSWVHTFSPNTLVTVSPFYHYNGADYHGGPNDIPVISNVTQTANYVGSQASIGTNFHNNDLQTGVYGFFQHQYNYFSNVYTCTQNCQIYGQPPNGLRNYGPSSIGVNGGVTALFINDKFKVTPWLTLIAGLRETVFTSNISEHATDPRLGAAVRIPHLNWTFRGFYGYYYQAPPLSTATSQLQQLGVNQGYGFAPLHGERDIEWQFGVMIPVHGWALDADNFETRAHNWLDHNNIGDSNLFWPITWSYAMIQGWELTLRSPDILHHGQFHLAYSNQIAQATSPITGGLICPPAMPICPLYPAPGLGPVDHDQRNTLNVGFNGNLPWHTYASTNVYYGSGFTNGLYGNPLAQYPGQYLPGHTAVDLSLGKTFAERYTVSMTAVNVANRRAQLDNSLTFGGFHWNDPRQIYGEFRYRFNY